MDLHTTSALALDWGFVLDRLARHARTTRGASRAAAPDFATNLDQALARYAEVSEVLALEGVGDRVPVAGIADVAVHAARASRGEVLDAPELLAVAGSVRGLVALQRWALAHEAPALQVLVAPIALDAALADRWTRAFDAQGQLSSAFWPVLGELRQKVESARGRILRTLDELVRGDALAMALQDRYATERDGRFVLPIKAAHRKGLGIVHGRSQSGETFYVEPAEVVELTNDLREAEADLIRETRRILALLSAEVGQIRDPLDQALDAACAVDLAVARAGLGLELEGIIPRIGTDGVILLHQARHPVLALRGVTVVPNSFTLDRRTPGLVLTGPNTGGKTVALKTLGLAALFVRAGIPFPARDDARVDFFDAVYADAGDSQAIQQDLSTFSGHIAVIRGFVEAARPGVLVLLDEVTAGTDPNQGAALARAIMEAVVDAGGRVAVTTHFAELKALSSADPRFVVAAMRYEQGRPTWRVETGVAGDSHAFAIAARLGMPAGLLDRARALLEPQARALSHLLEALEHEREASNQKAEALEKLSSELRFEQRRLEEREQSLKLREREVSRRLTAEFQERLRVREKEVRAMIAALQENPSLKLAGATLAAVRETAALASLPEPAPPPAPAAPDISVGDRVLVRTIQQRGKVLSIDGDRVEIEAGSMKMRARLGDLERLPGGKAKAAPAPRKVGEQRHKPLPRGEDAAIPLGNVRLPHNTCDLRGQRVEEALELVDRFLATLPGLNLSVGWILHGHGTGALKTAVRDWLPTHPQILRWRPADSDEGGDAFTVVEVR